MGHSRKLGILGIGLLSNSQQHIPTLTKSVYPLPRRALSEGYKDNYSLQNECHANNNNLQFL